jgi:2-haloacid dehalogenase
MSGERGKSHLADRRQLPRGAGAMVAMNALNVARSGAALPNTAIKAVVFDGFAIFDPGSIFRLAEELFPGHGAALSAAWRVRQFEYTWLRNSMNQYKNFYGVTQDALIFASKQTGVELHPEQMGRLMSAYLEMKPWPDVVGAIKELRERGLRLALLSNMTTTMMRACVTGSGLESAFEFQLSTDQVKAFKPAPVSYNMGLEAFQMRKSQIAFVPFGGWDAAGAKTFGYPTYWVNRLDAPEEELGVRADAIHHDLSRLPAFVASL